MYAVINRNSEIVKALLSFGADIETRNEYGSVLMSAARKSNVDAVRVLLEAGADIRVQLVEAGELHLSQIAGVDLSMTGKHAEKVINRL